MINLKNNVPFKIRFINHSSFIISNKNISIICDPWLDNKVFNNGWSQIAKTKMLYEEFKDITHIWFSHEHPDHFFPPNLNKIPKELRSRITILYQKTLDKKVIKYCEKIGFNKIIELKTNTYEKIGDSFEVVCNPVGAGDSYILFKIDNYKILNINDCLVTSKKRMKELKAIVGNNIDVLFSQFGYANVFGNQSQKEARVNAAKKKLNDLIFQIKSLKPKYTFPFASYIWFCHKENFYMNDSQNKIMDVYDFINDQEMTKPIILFPNDIWYYGEGHDNIKSIEKYKNCYKNITYENAAEANTISFDELISSHNTFFTNLKAKNKSCIDWINKFNINIFITDYSTSYKLSADSIIKNKESHSSNDISISSESLNYLFKFEWGGDTLNVNGRLQILENNGYQKLRVLSRMSSANNRGEAYYLPKNNLLKNIINKISIIN